MPANSAPGERSAWRVTLAAAAVLLVTMGARQSLGLFISPLHGSTGLGIASISLALAVAQLMWGVIQPIAGAAADRHGPARVLVAGLLVLAIGMAMTPFMTSGLGLIVSLGILSAMGAGAGSFSVLIGAATQHLATENRGKSAGIINAGGSLGQFIFAPLAQALIQMLGWMGAMWSLVAIAVGALPLVRMVSPARPLTFPATNGICAMAGGAGCNGRSQQVHSRDHVRLAHAVDRLVPGRAKIPADILRACPGSGTDLAGHRTAHRHRRGQAVRHTLPVHPVRPHLASHQIGGFLGAYLGGLALVRFGNYQWMWYADMAPAAAAALVNLPIREGPAALAASSPA